MSKTKVPVSSRIGQRFGKLVFLEVTGKDKYNAAIGRFQCDCGAITEICTNRAFCGKTTSCGCARMESLSSRRKHKVGHKFGRLLLVEILDKKHGRFVCDCGKEKVAGIQNAAIGNVRSCGCLRSELTSARKLEHGGCVNDTLTPEYRTWLNMKSRCLCKNTSSYAQYGGRGIAVCDRWMHSFENFLADMGNRPSSEHSIDRIDNDGPYSPENCRWASRKEQCRNRSSNIIVEYNGRSMILIEWSEELGIPYRLLHKRIFREGWSVDRALTEPIGTTRAEVSLTFNGKTQSANRWAKELGIGRTTIARRIKRGLPIEQILAPTHTTP